jgi:large subunit ribosomal protein L15
LQQHQFNSPRGAKKQRKRIGRGYSSGQGTYSGKGLKGQKARSGSGIRLGFQGGGLPLIKSLPKLRGFKRTRKVDYSLVNLGSLAQFKENSVVTPQILKAMDLVNDHRKPVKVLAGGTLEVALNIEAHKFSKQAVEDIQTAGGTVTEIKE